MERAGVLRVQLAVVAEGGEHEDGEGGNCNRRVAMVDMAGHLNTE